MRLHQVANKFNLTECVDAYTGLPAFSAQLLPYDDNKRDSETQERRVLSVAPGTILPTRRVVQALGMRFILGNRNPDHYRGAEIRIGLVSHVATELASIRTLGQVCRNEPGTSAWAARAWVKNLAYTEQSSKLAPQHHVHFALGEPVLNDRLVSFESRLLIVRAWNYGPAGTIVATCDELPEPTVEMASISGGVWNPVTETMSGSPTSVRVVRARWQSLYAYHHADAPAFGPDEMQLAIAKAVFTAKTGMMVTLSDGAWRLASCDSFGDVWLCRAVRHV